MDGADYSKRLTRTVFCDNGSSVGTWDATGKRGDFVDVDSADVIGEIIGTVSSVRIGNIESYGNIDTKLHYTMCARALNRVCEQTSQDWWCNGRTINVGKMGSVKTLVLRDDELHIHPVDSQAIRKRATKIYILGEGNGENQVVGSAEDTTTSTTIERVITVKAASTETEANAMASAYLDRHKYTTRTIGAEGAILHFWEYGVDVGDTVVIDFPGIQDNAVMQRIMKLTCSEPGGITVPEFSDSLFTKEGGTQIGTVRVSPIDVLAGRIIRVEEAQNTTQPDPSLALNDLSDVNAPTPSDNDTLTWDDATEKWIPEAAGGGGSTYLTYHTHENYGNGTVGGGSTNTAHRFYFTVPAGVVSNVWLSFDLMRYIMDNLYQTGGGSPPLSITSTMCEIIASIAPCKIYVDGVDKTSTLGGGAGFTTARSMLVIDPTWLILAGTEHYIEFRSTSGDSRVDARVIVKMTPS